jgi:histidinol dehydrogenase
MMKIISASQFEWERKMELGTSEQNESVLKIIADVRNKGDAAIHRYTERFDGVKLSSLRVSPEELEQAYEKVSEDFLTALRQAAKNIRSYHEKQKRTSWIDTQTDGTMLGQIIRPLQRVGLYVPGGSAAYPSSVLMNAIPALVAGVKEIVMITPPGREGINPAVLAAAKELGVSEIYQAGGAQAIAALAYGTETVRPVDKIVGPGNIYVALAKRYVFGLVDIDMIAGPSEIVVLADENANPAYVAADLLSQAEHVMASSILVTPSKLLAGRVAEEVERQLGLLSPGEIARESISERGAILLVNDLPEGVDVVNRLAPEHLEIMVDEPLSWVGRIGTAGAIFLGAYSSEPVGDYFAGPNHVLPTNGTARFSSPLNVDDFMKKSSLIYYSKEALMRDGEQIITLAEQEGLVAHAAAIRIRLDKEGGRS